MNLSRVIRAYLVKDNDFYNEKTSELKTKRVSIARDYHLLIKHYNSMNLSEEFVLFLKEFFDNPDPFIQLPNYFDFRAAALSNEIRSLKKKAFVIMKLFSRSLPLQCKETVISMIYLASTGESYRNKLKKNYLVIKQDFKTFKKTLTTETFEKLETESFIDAIKKFYETNL